MEQLNAALDRLQSALEGLEGAAEARLASAGDADEAQGVIERLRGERNELATELEQVRAHAASLEKVTDEVTGRLDGAIAGIREVLEG
jgi:predicted  nucleic acid-binding Zn-ribbon protein